MRRCGLVGLAGFGTVVSGIATLPFNESSESLLVTAFDCTPGAENVSLESTGLRGKAGHMRLLFWHSLGTSPERHCIDGKQFAISKDGDPVAMAVDRAGFCGIDYVVTIDDEDG